MAHNLTEELFDGYRRALFISSISTNSISLLINVLIMGVYLNYSMLKTSTNIYIAFSTGSALAFTVVDAVVYTSQISNTKQILPKAVTCIAEVFVEPVLGYFIIVNITLVAIQRILAITRGSRFSRAIDRRKTFLTFGLSVAYISLVCLAPFFGWYSVRSRQLACSNCYFEFYTDAHLAVLYVLARTVLLFVVPFLVMAMCYFIVYSTVKTTAVQRMQKRSKRNNSRSPDLSSSTRPKRRSIRTRLEARTVRTVIVVLTIFFFMLSAHEVFAIYLSITELTLNKLLVYHILWIIWKFVSQLFAMSQVLLNTHFRQHVLFSVCRQPAPSGEISATFYLHRSTTNGGRHLSEKHNHLGLPGVSFVVPSASSEVNYKFEVSTLATEDFKQCVDIQDVMSRSSSILHRTTNAVPKDGCGGVPEKSSDKGNENEVKESGSLLEVPSQACNGDLHFREDCENENLNVTSSSTMRHSNSAPCLVRALLIKSILKRSSEDMLNRSHLALGMKPDKIESLVAEMFDEPFLKESMLEKRAKASGTGAKNDSIAEIEL